MGKVFNYKRIIIMAFIGHAVAIFLFLLIKPDQPILDLLVKGFVGSGAAATIEILHELVKEIESRINDLKTSISDLNSRVSSINKEVFDRVSSVNKKLETLLVSLNNADNIHKELSGYLEDHQPMIARWLKDHLDSSIRHLHNISPDLFYYMLEESLSRTKNWEGIHEGSLKTLCLGDTARDSYLEALKAANHATRRRIVILSDKEFEDEHKNLTLIKEFMDSGGDQVESYLIKATELDKMLGQPDHRTDSGEQVGLSASRLHDCALHDKSLLLHYDRDIKCVLLGNAKIEPRARTIARIFNLLDQKPFKDKFMLIKYPNNDSLPTPSADN